MSRKPNDNIQISVQCHPNCVKEVRNYAKIVSSKEQNKSADNELRSVAHKSVVEYVEHSRGNNNVLNQIFYKGYVITPNLTGYVNYDFCKEDCEIIKGHGKSIDDCKIQIDEILEN